MEVRSFRFDPLPIVLEPAFHRLELRKLFGIGLGAVKDHPGFRSNPSSLERVAQLGGGEGQMPVLFEIVNEAECGEIGGVVAVNVRRNGQVVASQNDLLSLADALLEKRRRDGAFVDVE